MSTSLAYVARNMSSSDHHNTLVVPIVRIVPSIFARVGNVLAYAECLSSRPLPTTNALSLANLKVDQVWLSPNGRLYFIPPPDGQGPYRGLSLDDTGRTYLIETEVSYTDDSLPATQSLVRQMEVLREASQERSSQGQQAGENKSDLRLRYDTIIVDGHRRFEVAMNAIDEASEPATGQDAIVEEIATMIGEHGSELDRYLTATFPPQSFIA